jgi:hypothetical protein
MKITDLNTEQITNIIQTIISNEEDYNLVLKEYGDTMSEEDIIFDMFYDLCEMIGYNLNEVSEDESELFDEIVKIHIRTILYFGK